MPETMIDVPGVIAKSDDADVTANAWESGSDVFIALSGADVLTIENYTLAACRRKA